MAGRIGSAPNRQQDGHRFGCFSRLLGPKEKAVIAAAKIIIGGNCWGWSSTKDTTSGMDGVCSKLRAPSPPPSSSDLIITWRTTDGLLLHPRNGTSTFKTLQDRFHSLAPSPMLACYVHGLVYIQIYISGGVQPKLKLTTSMRNCQGFNRHKRHRRQTSPIAPGEFSLSAPLQFPGTPSSSLVLYILCSSPN